MTVIGEKAGCIFPLTDVCTLGTYVDEERGVYGRQGWMLNWYYYRASYWVVFGEWTKGA